MQPNLTLLGISPVTLINGATSAPFVPLVSGANVSNWNGANRAVPEFDLEIYSDLTVNLTSATLYGGVLKAGTIAGFTVTAANSTEIFTATAHGLHTGDGPVQWTTTGGAPTGISLLTDYWIIKLTADTFYLAASLADALAGTKVLISTDGTGTNTLTGTSATKLMRLCSFGLLGHAADGAVNLTIRQAYSVRVKHRPNVIMYWISAGFSAANAVYAAVYPIQS